VPISDFFWGGVGIAKNAGMKYIVITSKHHDGFAIFDSKASDWNIVAATPFHRDPLKKLAAVYQKQGMKLGFYYSAAVDHRQRARAQRAAAILKGYCSCRCAAARRRRAAGGRKGDRLAEPRA
jgi:alpha-L-fucosidase